MISCAQHDFIEVVCLFKYPVKLTLIDGNVVVGVAKDTNRTADLEECIELDVDGETRLVVLTEITRLVVQVANPHVDEVVFTPQ